MCHIFFEPFNIASSEADNAINLEVPLVPLQRALRSATGSTSTFVRLTKKDGNPVLSLTITTSTAPGGGVGGDDDHTGGSGVSRYARQPGPTQSRKRASDDEFRGDEELRLRRDREKTIDQDLPVRVLHPETVKSMMQPRARDAEVHIHLPPLAQLKAVSDRFTSLAANSGPSASGGAVGGRKFLGANDDGPTGGGRDPGAIHPKLLLSATMHGQLSLRVDTADMSLETTWSGLSNPRLDPEQLEDPSVEPLSEVMRRKGPDAWAKVRIDGRDWSRVLSVGRLQGNLNGRKVVASFSHEHTLILHVYVPVVESVDYRLESCLTYYITSYSDD